MKLHRLEMEGIGSFADHMHVDFSALTNAGLFLIEGPTGSGKSTILDAIVFALYGSVAGSGSDSGRLDSHLRARSPWVELEFEVAGARYCVRRSPAHQRAKKRGEGTTAVNTTVSLMRLTPGPVELGTRASEVAEQIIEIIGLTKQQFVSTVVLAQGEFASFLDAGTADRTQILERIFGTQFYQQVEDQLHQMRKLARQQRTVAADSVDEIVEQCKGILDTDFEEDDPLAHIDGVLTALRCDLAQARQSAEDAEQARSCSHADLQAAQRLVADQARKRSALDEQAELDATQDEVDQWRAQMQAHRAATPLKPTISAWRQAVAESTIADKHLTGCTDALAAIGEGTQPRANRLQQVIGLLGALEGPARLERELTDQRAEVEKLHTDAQRAREDLKAAQQASDAVQAELATVSQEFDECPDASDAKFKHSLRVEQLEESRRLWVRVQAQRRELSEVQHKANTAHLQLSTAEAELATAEQALRNNQAAGLAATLVDGQPCLVCGSCEHPAPARAPTHAPSEVKTLAAAVEQRRKHALDADQALNKLTGAVEDALLRLTDDDPAAVEEQLMAARDDLNASTAQQARREILLNRLQELNARERERSKALERAKLSEFRCASRLDTALLAIEKADDTVSEARAGYASVEARVAALTQIREAQSAALAAESTARSRRDDIERTAQVLARTLEAAGFPDATAAEDRILPEARVSQLTGGIEQWETSRACVQADLKNLADVDLTVHPDLEALEMQVQAANEVTQKANARVTTLTDRIASLAPRKEELHARLEALDRIRQETEPVIRMADLATAQRNEVVHRVRLTSFVLMRRFEEVIDAANDRLDTISEGRYQLVVVASGLDARSQAGLDLRVYDGRSDSQRSTRSLSGGERFYVSLALALGLADVVRAESGGVELGTLFIDEGFGSLDAEVLEEVMDMLEQVRVGEDRAIGLISHVEALKARIDSRISVRRIATRPGVSMLEVHA
jgi:exonuclease SbcC